MFSVEQKRQIADAVQQVLRATNHPELPAGEIVFHLHVNGAAAWSWADIRNNGAVPNPDVNPWNEHQARLSGGGILSATPDTLPPVEVGDVILMNGHGRPMAALVTEVDGDDRPFIVRHQEFQEDVRPNRVLALYRTPLWQRGKE
jgi:hypothetical protein